MKNSLIVSLVLLLFLVRWSASQVYRRGRLSDLKRKYHLSDLEKKDLNTFTLLTLPRLDNCVLFLESMLKETAVSNSYRRPYRPQPESFFNAEEKGNFESIPFNYVNDTDKSFEYPSDDTKHSTTKATESLGTEGVAKETHEPIHSGSFAFGRGIPVDIDVLKKGTWFSLKGNMGRILKLGIKSPTAYSLNLLFDQFWLPTGAELYIHGQTAMLGAYTAAVNNKPHGKFATTPLPGSFLLIEYYAPEHVIQNPILHIISVVHGFRPIFTFPVHKPEREAHFAQDQVSDTLSSVSTEYNSSSNFEVDSSCSNDYLMDSRVFFSGMRSGSCNINAPACPEASDFVDHTKSVAIVMTANGQKFCTGAMLNNERMDGKQLFLTADHCVNEINSDFRFNILGFNYQSKVCQNNPTEWPLIHTAQGLKLLARSRDSDFALFEVQERIPSTYDIFFSGWSASQASPSFVYTIHHPSGDVKKISLTIPRMHPHTSITLECWNECPKKSHWRVSRWSKGVTEPGSSGAPLFNQDGLIIGQLHGGASSCRNLEGFDMFGAFHASFHSKSTHLSSLKHWLDPDKTGCDTIKGDFLREIRRKAKSTSR